MDLSRSDVFSGILDTVGSSPLCGRRLKKTFPGQTAPNWGSVRGYSPRDDLYVSCFKLLPYHITSRCDPSIVSTTHLIFSFYAMMMETMSA